MGLFVAGLVLGIVIITLLYQWPDICRSYARTKGIRYRNRLMTGTPKRVMPIETWHQLAYFMPDGAMRREYRVFRLNGKKCFFRWIHDDQDVVLEFEDSDFEDDDYVARTLTRTFYEKPNGFKESRVVKVESGRFESRQYPVKLECILDVY